MKYFRKRNPPCWHYPTTAQTLRKWTSSRTSGWQGWDAFESQDAPKVTLTHASFPKVVTVDKKCPTPTTIPIPKPTSTVVCSEVVETPHISFALTSEWKESDLCAKENTDPSRFLWHRSACLYAIMNPDSHKYRMAKACNTELSGEAARWSCFKS